MPINKDVRDLIRQVQGWAGWRVEETKKGWMVYPADKSQSPIAIHGTPSDHRAWKNILGRLRRAGGPI